MSGLKVETDRHYHWYHSKSYRKRFFFYTLQL